MIISLMGAASENNVIGKDNWLPWDLPAELAHFRSLTRGKPVIMGRKTYDSIAARGRAPLPGRHNIIVSRDADKHYEGADVVSSIEEAIELARKDGAEEACVIGGEGIYRLAIPLADKIFLTRVHTTIDGGEAFFPEFDEAEWKLTKSERHEADAENAIPFTMMMYERK